MSKVCYISGKKAMSGNNVSHAKNRTKRKFFPNLRSYKMTLEDGSTKRVKVSAKALRTLRKKA